MTLESPPILQTVEQSPSAPLPLSNSPSMPGRLKINSSNTSNTSNTSKQTNKHIKTHRCPRRGRCGHRSLTPSHPRRRQSPPSSSCGQTARGFLVARATVGETGKAGLVGGKVLQHHKKGQWKERGGERGNNMTKKGSGKGGGTT